MKVQHEDNEGWVTNQHSARILDEQGAQQKTGLNKHEEALSSTAQHGEFIRLSAEGQSGNYGTYAVFDYYGIRKLILLIRCLFGGLPYY